jgi:hypothetical protein
LSHIYILILASTGLSEGLANGERVVNLVAVAPK